MNEFWEQLKPYITYKTISMAIIVILAAIIGLWSIKYMGQDGPIEEQCEQVIQDQTGVEIDLTPASPEITK